MKNDIKRLTDPALVARFRDERKKQNPLADEPLHPTKDTIENRLAFPDDLQNLLGEMKRRGIATPPV